VDLPLSDVAGVLPKPFSLAALFALLGPHRSPG
jgi:hypothetical protein